MLAQFRLRVARSLAESGVTAPVWAAALLSCLGLGTFLLLPTLVEAAVIDLKFSEWQLGILSAGLSGGTMVAGLCAPWWVRTVSWRVAASVCLVGLVLANGGAMMAHGFVEFCVLQCLVGFFGGSLYSLALTVISDEHQPDRGFAFAVGAQTLYQVLALVAGPRLISAGGMNAVLMLFMGLSALGGLLIAGLPSHGRMTARAPIERHRVLSGPVILALLGCMLFYVNIGVFWTYVERIGAEAALSSSSIANALSLSTATSFIGVALAYRLGNRLGYVVPIGASAAAVALVVWMLSGQPGLLNFLLANIIYAIAWNVSMTYQYGALNAVDRSRRSVAMAPSFHNAGSAIGPAIAAWVVTRNDHTGALWLIAASVFLSLGFFAVAFSAGKRHS
jgi:predicted MFS family arabinose efflux permease